MSGLGQFLVVAAGTTAVAICGLIIVWAAWLWDWQT